MYNLEGKKLLVMGGAFQHCKLVEAAKELGVITYVTDYLPLENAPAKQIADKYFMYNITDIEGMAKMCMEEKIDGVISTSLDACQKPYQRLCEALKLPCFGTKEQFDILTDKNLFKSHCKKSGVDTIPEYRESDFETEEICNKNVEFPILVKPGESRGSRGQSICYSYEETKGAIEFAKKESSNGAVVIEKYMGQANDFSMTILMINGNAYPIRTVDRILGKYEDKLDKLAVGSASPSIFTKIYMENVHKRVEKLYRDIGIVNAPVFMQGFVDGDTVRFYDPGLRLPGGEYERMFTIATGKNPMFPLVEFALTGEIKNTLQDISENDIYVNGKTIAQVLPTLRAGTISKIEGVEEIRNHPYVVAMFTRFSVGDTIVETHNVNQRFAEIDLVCQSDEDARDTTEFIYKTLKIYDQEGNDMLVSKFDPSIYLKRKQK
ncbi:MAG: hypothetical protein E7602_01930 [Ruminococcaceae bacterium]|nr:hypothetical protein [Oscillospiraceae bacterium]